MILRSYLGGGAPRLDCQLSESFAICALLLAVSGICIWVASVPAVGEYDKRVWVGRQ